MFSSSMVKSLYLLTVNSSQNIVGLCLPKHLSKIFIFNFHAKPSQNFFTVKIKVSNSTSFCIDKIEWIVSAYVVQLTGFFIILECI